MNIAPNSYPGMSMAEYLALPAVSAGVIRKLLDECPAAARHASWLNPLREREDTAATDAGSIAHAILLEGSTAGVAVIDPEDHPAEKTGAIPEGWTNKSIRAARDAARASGLIPVLRPAMLEIEAMVDSAQDFIASLKTTEPAIWALFQPDGGESELTCVWQDGPTACRMRPDRISHDRRVIVDAKFTATSAEPDRWGRTQLTGMGYYMSAAFYRRGSMALWETQPDYVFLVVETAAPYLCSLVGVDPAGLELGAEKVEVGLREWARCIKSDSWPGYPAKVAYPEIPAWEQARWLERQGLDAQGIPYDPKILYEVAA